jgi:hypothetical protein
VTAGVVTEAANGLVNWMVNKTHFRRPLLPVLLPEIAAGRLMRQRRISICRKKRRTGATGLEPATSGVTEADDALTALATGRAV